MSMPAGEPWRSKWLLLPGQPQAGWLRLFKSKAGTRRFLARRKLLGQVKNGELVVAADTDIASVYAVEDARFEAMTNNDVVALAKLLADDLHYVHSNGVVEDKAEFLRKITSGERRFRSFRGITRHGRYEGGFTFVVGDAEVQVDRAAGFLKNRITYTAIYRNEPSPQFIAWHAVKSVAADA